MYRFSSNDRFNLKFEYELEEKYKAYSTNNDTMYIRYAFLLFTILYGLFCITDYILVPQWFSLFFAIRFYVVIPLFLLTIGLTFHPNYYIWKQPLILFNLLVGGISISVMLVLEPLNVIYYGGLFLVLTSGYFMLHLRTIYAIFGGFTMLLTFIVGVLLRGQMNVVIFSATLFLIAENLVGSFGAFQLERLKRSEFLHIHSLNLEQTQLHHTVHEKSEEISVAQISTIRALANLVESRDKETGDHLDRVGTLCFKITEALPIHYFLSEQEKSEFCQAIEHASTLHDIGKVGITDSILNKPGPLTEAEFDLMKIHTEIGSNTLKKLHEQYPKNYLVKLGIEITQYHHEHFDGNGYPEGLKGFEIPLSARIMAIVDVYDALISIRPYKPAFTHDHAIDIIMSESGKHFDPDLVLIFCRLFESDSHSK
jgi:HD-GYP domain-containing protein (c-di-GMP phosphodiesterase class II)